MSGHVFFADRFFGFDDAVYATLRLLEILADEDRPLHELLADVPKTASTPEIRVACPDGAKFDVVERIKERFATDHEVITVDGARILFEGGWGLVRASNTQPVLVLRFEAESDERLGEIREDRREGGGGGALMARRTLGMEDALFEYLLDVAVHETDVMRRLREETARMEMGRMQIGPDQGAFMSWLVSTTGAKRAIEVGTFTGYSALCVASALPEGGELLCCDVSEEFTSVAKRYWDEAGLTGKIELRIGPAIETLRSLEDDGAWDFAFIDADKTGYDAYYEELLRLLRPGGVIAVDNVLWGGSVADPADERESTVALRALNRKIAADARGARLHGRDRRRDHAGDQAMSQKGWIGAAAGIAAIVAILLAWDALVVTDEERLEGFVEDVTGPIARGRVSAARERWVDLERQPLEVSALGRSLLYRAGDDEALADEARSALSGLRGTDLTTLSSAIVVEGDEATVTLRLMSRERGMGAVRWELRRHGDDWLAARLAVTR